MMKRLLSICILLMAACTTASAYDFKVDGIYYNKNSDGRTVTVTDRGYNSRTYSGNIMIPSSVMYEGNSYTVTAIADNAFYYNINLLSVHIPATVTSIGKEAFYYCYEMTTVSGGGGIVSVGGQAFFNCKVLESINLGDNLETIDAAAFYQCYELKSVKFGSKITYIGRDAFNYCYELDNIQLPNSMTEISDYAFSRCFKLKNINFPTSLTKIGKYAFRFTAITHINLPSGVKTIGKEAFWLCTQVESISIPSGVKRIENNAFYGVGDNMKSLTIPGTVKYIGEGAFGGFKNLESLTISEGVDSLADGAFCQIPKLKTITIPRSIKYLGGAIVSSCESLTTVYYNAENCVFDPNFTRESVFARAPITKVVVGEGVKSIPGRILKGHTSVAEVMIPSTVTSIGAEAFSNCPTLLDIFVNQRIPIVLSADISDATGYEKTFLHVPEGCDKYYKGRDYWKNFKQIFDDRETYRPTVAGDVNGDGVLNVGDVTTIINMILGK